MFVNVIAKSCVGCNTCIRACPVPEVNVAKQYNVAEHTIIDVDNTKCVSCGACLKSCAHNARTYQDDTQKFFKDLQNGKNIILMVAPAFRITEPNSDAILESLKKMGVKTIYDVSYGADICTWGHIRAIKKKLVGKVISQPCAALTEYIIRYKPNLLKYLSPVHSPISCMAVFLRKTVGVSDAIACISPCIAKKQEFGETGLVQYNVTFKSLVKYMSEHNLTNNGLGNEFKFTNLPAFCGKIYPRPGGLKECLLNLMPQLSVVNAEGVDHVYQELDVYEKTADQYKPDVFDVLSCGSGCIEGPGTNYKSDKSLEYSAKMNNVENRAFNDRKKQTIMKIDKQFSWFDKHLNLNDYIRTYKKQNIQQFSVSQNQLGEAYKKLLKFDETSRKYNCQACGYDTCKEMATAIATGLNVPKNCYQYVSKCITQEHEEVQTSNYKLHEVNNQITSATTDVMKHVNEISEYAKAVSTNSSESLQSMNEIKGFVDVLTEQCERISEAMDGVANVNQQYKEMSTAIREITDQTHILSINASVEAARAGERGKAFSVVAGEIRSLAANTRNTTANVEESDATIKAEIKSVEVIQKKIEKLLGELSSSLERFGKSASDTADAGNMIDVKVIDISNDTELLNNLTKQ